MSILTLQGKCCCADTGGGPVESACVTAQLWHKDSNITTITLLPGDGTAETGHLEYGQPNKTLTQTSMRSDMSFTVSSVSPSRWIYNISEQSYSNGASESEPNFLSIPSVLQAPFTVGSSNVRAVFEIEPITSPTTGDGVRVVVDWIDPAGVAPLIRDVVYTNEGNFGLTVVDEISVNPGDPYTQARVHVEAWTPGATLAGRRYKVNFDQLSYQSGPPSHVGITCDNA